MVVNAGRSVHVVSLGCARNQVDSEVLGGRLAAAGWRIVSDPARAATIIVNTCSFIRAAADESIDTILEAARHKQTGRCRRLIVTGCLPERYREQIAQALPEVDVFLGTGAYGEILTAMHDRLPPGSCRLPDPNRAPQDKADTPRRLTQAHTAYLKVADGCMRRCTYCIIPRLRGRQRSRALPDLVAETQTLVRQGVREIVLVAQESTAYGIDLTPRLSLAELLEALSAVAGQVWLRVLYGHPESIDAAAIDTIARLPNVLSYYDLPIQHASQRMLRRMGRRYTAAELRLLFERIRASDPQACLRTTAIVGFPGESAADFRELLALAEEVRFDHLGVFEYSDAEDLPSHRLSGHVAARTARRRRERLMRRQLELLRQRQVRHVGQCLPVLLEARAEAGIYVGRTAFQAPEVDGITLVHGHELTPGAFIMARITGVQDYDLEAEVA